MKHCPACRFPIEPTPAERLQASLDAMAAEGWRKAEAKVKRLEAEIALLKARRQGSFMELSQPGAEL